MGDRTAAEPNPEGPGPLVDGEWLAAHLDDPDLRIVHVSTSPDRYAAAHLPGAVFARLEGDLGRRGTTPETGAAELEALLPDRTAIEASLARWGVGEGDRVVFYDDVGRNRYAVRGYWLLRVHGVPRGRLHVLDGGLAAWRRAGRPTASSADDLGPPAAPARPVRLGDPDPALLATLEDVRRWGAESVEAGTVRLLDVRSPEEFDGTDVRAARGGHVPGARNRRYEDLLRDDGTFRPVPEALELLRSAGIEPADLRAAYCQTGTRSALAWFVLHELAGFGEVRNYAGSWEEWGNRTETPVETS